jgi:hypothetical protein
MAKNNSQPGEGPGEIRAGEAAETQAGTAEGAAQTEAKTEAEVAKAEVEAKKEDALIRHRTPYEKYRCAGLVLTQKVETHRVTKAQLEKLRRDPWVALEKENAPK